MKLEIKAIAKNLKAYEAQRYQRDQLKASIQELKVLTAPKDPVILYWVLAALFLMFL